MLASLFATANPAELDAIRLNFSPDSLRLLNFCLAFIMFGVALDLKWGHFRALAKRPKSALAGLLSQLVLLPAFTVLLIWVLKPAPGLALGMLLVAACPGGATSNFITHLARGNVALSIGLTSVVTILAFILTPFNYTFWSTLLPETSGAAAANLTIDPLEMMLLSALILGLPVAVGMLFAAYLPLATAWIRRPVRALSLLIFLAFIVLAFKANWAVFLQYAGVVIGLVILHNAIAFGLGFGTATLLGTTRRERRAITIETGIQNSGLGLVLIFDFYGGIGSMALIAGIWGVWHFVTGGLLAAFWARRPIDEEF